jgi:plasmid stabilization system protein ParE
MKIAFDPDANDDLDHISAWIAKGNSPAAREMMARIEAHIARLATAGLKRWDGQGSSTGRTSSSRRGTSSSKKCLSSAMRLSSSQSCMVRCTRDRKSAAIVTDLEGLRRAGAWLSRGRGLVAAPAAKGGRASVRRAKDFTRLIRVASVARRGRRPGW